jgi:23S rRNA (guanosine2251-2'-O)-methyltransferase
MNQNTQKPAMREDIVIGRNAVAELLRSGRAVERVWLKRGLGGSLNQLAARAKDIGAVIKDVDPAKLDSLCDRANHQGAVAEAAAARYSVLEDAFALA